MAKLIVFQAVGFSGTSKEYRSNDPDLVANGEEFTFASAICIDGEWTASSEVNYMGDSVSLGTQGGPDGDGTYKDPADWEGTSAFSVLSIQHA